MLRINNVKIPLEYGDNILKRKIADRIGISSSQISSVKIAKKSVDARKKQDICFIMSLDFTVRDEAALLLKCDFLKAVEPYCKPTRPKPVFSSRPVIVGFGPAGIFAALTLAESGARPIVLERGLDVDSRTAAVKEYWSGGKLNPDCNVQFGEGGAGTFSDGKLTTGTKDSRINEVFHSFVEFGAPEEILTSAKPHIGTDRLAPTVKEMRKHVLALGGEVIFGARFSKIAVEKGRVSSVSYEKDGKTQELATDCVILAIGHSARDTFELLRDNGVDMSKKSFSVGVRIEHLQADLNRSMYGLLSECKALPPADYKLVAHLPNGRNVYSFCMCPGGQVVAAASEPNSITTNGMSYFERNGENANSALLVSVTPDDFPTDDVLAGVEFQRAIERKAFTAAGGNGAAPIALAGDFLDRKTTERLGKVKPTYLPKTSFVLPDEYLPDYVCEALRRAIPEFVRKVSCFSDRDAVITGPETRSSSPVRINRGESCESVSVKGLFPCGEGAGYAGGIVSAAVDGIRCAEAIIFGNE